MTTRDITRRAAAAETAPAAPTRPADRGSGQLLGSCSPTLAASTRQRATKIFQ